eukprot:8411-Eustigmatos_ZCMA.PRE.1
MCLLLAIHLSHPKDSPQYAQCAVGYKPFMGSPCIISLLLAGSPWTAHQERRVRGCWAGAGGTT